MAAVAFVLQPWNTKSQFKSEVRAPTRRTRERWLVTMATVLRCGGRTSVASAEKHDADIADSRVRARVRRRLATAGSWGVSEKKMRARVVNVLHM